MSKIVVALGGNALGDTAAEQQQRIEAAAPVLAEIAKQKDLVICHGNGPQVGMVQLAFENASRTSDKVPPMELPECTAMSQGYIGYHLQKGLGNALKTQGIDKSVSTVVTQVAVDEKDPAFRDPSKPIGAFYTKEQADELKKIHPEWEFKEDSGRGWRRVVASPKPSDIVEKDTIKRLLANDFVVIACGGGGIPVVQDGYEGFRGVPAVIDKDHASAKLAQLIDAEELYILTAVDKVAINFGKPDQKELDELTLKEAEQLCREGQFGKGSMLPKVEAAMSFIRSGGKKAVIASLDKAAEAVNGRSGTRFVQ